MTVRQRRFVAGAGEIICWLYIYRIAAKLLGITILIALLGTPGLSASRETVTSAYLLGGAIVALLAHEQGRRSLRPQSESLQKGYAWVGIVSLLGIAIVAATTIVTGDARPLWLRLF